MERKAEHPALTPAEFCFGHYFGYWFKNKFPASSPTGGRLSAIRLPRRTPSGGLRPRLASGRLGDARRGQQGLGSWLTAAPRARSCGWRVMRIRKVEMQTRWSSRGALSRSPFCRPLRGPDAGMGPFLSLFQAGVPGSPRANSSSVTKPELGGRAPPSPPQPEQLVLECLGVLASSPAQSMCAPASHSGDGWLDRPPVLV